MTLRIITGTLTEAKDPFGRLQQLYQSGAFYRYYWTGERWIKKVSDVVSVQEGKHVGIYQTVGSGKTILSSFYLYRAYMNGINTAANYSLKWTENNKGKEKRDWQPALNQMEDIENIKFSHICLDDIRGTITAWNTKEARLVSMLALCSRKFHDWIDITTQRLENFVPPDMRFITDEIIVPYIRTFDATRIAPDGRYAPLEILPLRFSPGQEFIGAGKMLKLYTKEGLELLDSYDTLQVAAGLKQGEDAPRTNQPGYELEVKAFEYLKDKVPKYEWRHLNGKAPFDIVSNEIAVDVCSMDDSGDLRTEHKHINYHISVAKKKGWRPFLMFPYKDSWGFVRIGPKMAHRHTGERIDTFHIPILSLETAIK